MSRHNKDRSLEWGSVNRSSNKLGIPNRSEGRDGDIQVRQTNLGAKLFGKIGGSWNSTFLSSEDQIIGTSGTKIGMDSSGNFSATSIHLSGKILVGNRDGSFNASDNFIFGNGNSSDTTITQNTCIGYQAGKLLSTVNAYGNVLIGFQAGAAMTTTPAANVAIGYECGKTIETGDFNICLGMGAKGTVDAQEQIAIGKIVVCDTNETLRIGDNANYLLYDFSSGGEVSITSDERVKKNIVDTDIGLEFINALRPIKYTPKEKHEYPGEIFQDGANPIKEGDKAIVGSKKVEGFLAQEVKQVMDDLDVTFSGWHQNKSSRQMLDYSSFVVPLTKAVQELSAKLDTMQTEINNLKTE